MESETRKIENGNEQNLNESKFESAEKKENSKLESKKNAKNPPIYDPLKYHQLLHKEYEPMIGKDFEGHKLEVRQIKRNDNDPKDPSAQEHQATDANGDENAHQEENKSKNDNEDVQNQEEVKSENDDDEEEMSETKLKIKEMKEREKQIQKFYKENYRDRVFKPNEIILQMEQLKSLDKTGQKKEETKSKKKFDVKEQAGNPYGLKQGKKLKEYKFKTNYEFKQEKPARETLNLKPEIIEAEKERLKNIVKKK